MPAHAFNADYWTAVATVAPVLALANTMTMVSVGRTYLERKAAEQRAELDMRGGSPYQHRRLAAAGHHRPNQLRFAGDRHGGGAVLPGVAPRAALAAAGGRAGRRLARPARLAGQGGRRGRRSRVDGQKIGKGGYCPARLCPRARRKGFVPEVCAVDRRPTASHGQLHRGSRVSSSVTGEWRKHAGAS